MRYGRDLKTLGETRTGVLFACLAICMLMLACGCAPSTPAIPGTASPTATQAAPTGQSPKVPLETPASLAALQPDNLPLRFDHLPPEAGLSQSVVNNFVQDQQGFLWLATQDGLNRYDGENFKVFKDDPEQPGSIKGNFVSSLEIDSTGGIWAGTSDGGLNRYDPATGLFTSYQNDPSDPESLGENSVSALAVDLHGIVWVGTNNSGVNRLDPGTGKFTRYLSNPDDSHSLGSNNVTSLQVDPQGYVWVGTLGGGLNRLDPATSQVTRYQNDPNDPGSLSDSSVQTVYFDRQGVMWVGTFLAGLNRFDPQADRFIRYQYDPADPDSLSHNSVASIYEDQRGNLWVGTQGGGLNLMDRHSSVFTHYQHNPADPTSLSNDYLLPIFEDSSGILWLGTFGSGADYYDPAKDKFLLLRSEPGNLNSLSNNSIWAIYEDPQGTLWIGSNGGGLSRHDPVTNEWQHFRNDPNNPESLANDWILSIHQDPQGIFWLGTPAGLDRFDPQTTRFMHYPMPIVLDIYQDSDSLLWLATGQGLFVFDPVGSVVTTYLNNPDDPASLSSNTVSVIHEGLQGDLWVGTLNGGLNHLDRESGRFTRFTNDPAQRDSLSANSVLSIYRDQAGTLWVGTGGGLNRLDSQTGSFDIFREKNGMPNNYVYGILEDDHGNLWLSTNKGLSRFNPANLQFKNYDSTDGLQGPEFNQGAYFKNREGVMYFGGVNGLNAFHPDQIQDNPFIPPVIITNFEIFNQPVPVGPDSPLQQPIEASQEIRLAYTDDFFGFEYAALHFSSPAEIQYAYKMDALDRDWNYVEGNHLASYTNVPPGKYTFRVKATNSDGVWNEQGAALRILIPPPFWQTTWFRLLAALAVLGGISAVFVTRLRSLEGQRLRLEEQVEQRTYELRQAMTDLETAKDAAESASRAKSTFLANMSHEFRTPLNAILGFTQIMLRDRALSTDEHENVQIIHRSSEHLLGLINDVLEMSKIEAGRITMNQRSFDLHRMLAGLQEMFSLRTESKGLALKLELAPEVPRYIKTDEGKLRQVLMNLLGNAVKFTQQGHVILRAHPCLAPAGGDESGTWICFSVEDTGPGISKEDLEILFTPFVQTTAGLQSPEGTGLGLPISQQFVNLMGSQIQVSSQEGSGSIFRFSMPVEVVQAGDLEKPPPGRRVVGLQPGQPVYRLLAVDDQEFNRLLLVKLFEPLGFEVRSAANGQEALEMWESWAPQLIWMDMRMPVMDGYEATRRIKATTRGMATIIIALTASALEEDRAVILSEGCDDYIRKPFHEEELYAAVAKYLGVQYIYEEVQTAPGQPAAGMPPEMSEAELQLLVRQLARLDPGWLADLEHATILGDQQAILQAAGQIAGQDPALAESLARLANQFDHDRILSLIQQARLVE